MKLKYVITGTGRCGTVFMARFLTSLGIPCGHESIFGHEGLEVAKRRLNEVLWPDLSHASKMSLINGKWHEEPVWIKDLSKIQADASYMAAPFLDDKCLTDTKIIHVVRNPIEVVQSFCNYINYFKSNIPSNKYEEFIYGKIKELTNSISNYDRACLFYIIWNEMIEKRADFFHRIEDDPNKICDFISVHSQEFFSNKSINSYKRWTEEKFDIHMISDSEIKKKFVAMGRRYGYKMSTPLII